MTTSSLFDTLVGPTVLRHEAGLVDDPRDPGGLTNFGWALNENPDLTADEIRNMTSAQALQRYYDKRWAPARWRDLPAPIAVKVFDASVNMDPNGAGAAGIPSMAVRCLQRACRACGRHVLEDGILGGETVGAAGYFSPPVLLAALKSELAAHYRLVAQAKPAEHVFLEDWLGRAYE